MWVAVGVSEGREQVQLICVPQTRVPGKVTSALSRSSGSLEVGNGGPPRAASLGLGREGASGVSSGPPGPTIGYEESFRHPGAYLGPGRRREGPGQGCGRPR